MAEIDKAKGWRPIETAPHSPALVLFPGGGMVLYQNAAESMAARRRAGLECAAYWHPLPAMPSSIAARKGNA